ncbi:MAG: LysR substrate-binding domain-containing protein [Thiohalocapsa sp.]
MGLASRPVACYERSSASRRVVENAFSYAGLKSPVVFELASNQEILEFAESGACIGLLAESAAPPARYPGLRFLPTVALFPALTTAIIVRRNAPLSWAAVDFIELLTEDASSRVLSIANDSRLV